MLRRLVRMIGGDPDKKRIDQLAVMAGEIDALETQYEVISDEELIAKTREFRIRLAKGETLDDIMPAAYATVREVSKRTIGLRHYTIQIAGGIALHQGIIAEMKTGEGKTLVATLPLYLNALALNLEWMTQAKVKWGADPEGWTFAPIDGIPVGRGAHLVTVNDYLARRDARWKAPIYNMLGLTVGVLQMASRTEHGNKAFVVDLGKSSPHEDQDQLQMVSRREAYDADITYGTNNEFGFDYLRDNMKMSLAERVQRGHHYAIIDEVDNVLIDEARTPLIISGPSHEDTGNYERMAQLVKQLKPEDYEISIRDRNITLTEIGETHVEQILGMALRDPERPEDITPEQARLLGHLEQALRAEYIYKRNKEYIVQAGKVVIVDDFTGRLMPGRRWSDGLHQAVEAKEGAKVQSENVTYATITIQNYFRMYEKLAGMTGTAVTEAEEFNSIYKLDALAIPTNLEYLTTGEDATFAALEDRDEYGYKYTYYVPRETPQSAPAFWKRKDYPDVIYRSEEAKLRALVREILTYHVIGRPILVGTTSVEISDLVSTRLKADPIRRLVQTLLIREAWVKKNNRTEDGRQIPELQHLNVPLDKLRATELRKMIREMDLAISINPEDERNFERLITMFDLSPSHQERLAGVLRGGVPHQVLNARKHTEESQIIAGAGAFGAVTIATNMAGRGVDIKLGGELAEEVISTVNRVLRKAGLEHTYDMSLDERRQALLALDPGDYGIYEIEIKFFLKSMTDMRQVKVLGGLHVIGSERHEARRIDNQLRGRAARQGDPGSSRFYLSLEDNLMLRFGGQQMEGVLSRLSVDEALPIENVLVSRIVEGSQTRVEGSNFDVRKHLLEYDDVLNTQRTKIYEQRDRIFLKDDLSADVTGMLREEVMQRVPESLKDEDGPWKLLSWLEQIQPPLILKDGIFPSYTLKLLLEGITGGQATADHRLPTATLSRSTVDGVRHSEAREVLLNLAADAIRAEKEHHLHHLHKDEGLFDQSQTSMEFQIAERLETLDTFIEGIYLADETDTRGPQELATELTGLLRLPIKLTSDQTRLLRTDPEAVGDVVREQVEQLVRGLFIVRLVGAVERVLRESLELDNIDLRSNDWNSITGQVLDAIEATFDQRQERYIGNGTPGQIAADLDINLEKMGDPLSERDLLNLILAMPQGRRAGFDKKTHRRVWARTTRLTFIHLAARRLANRDPEEIAADVLAHLENAQAAIRREWGQNEMNRLAKADLSSIEEPARAGLQHAVGEDAWAAIRSQSISALSDDQQSQIIDELGRQGLTRVYRELLLRVISNLWVEYLTQMEALRVAIGLEAYAQRDPLVQYKTRAFEMFQNLLNDMRVSLVTSMFTFRARAQSAAQASISREEEPPDPEAAPEAEVTDAQPAKKKRRRRRR